MIRPILIHTFVLGCLACSGGASNAPGAAVTTPGTSPAYQIVLSRPFTAGDRLRAVVVARQQIAATHDNDKDDQGQATISGTDKNMDLSLAGVLTIREVDANGRALSAVLDVEHFTEGTPATDIVPPGAQIEAVRKGDKFALKVDDKPRPDLQKFLDLAFPLHRPGSPRGDELFGTKEPKQIGDTWSFSKSKVTESLVEDGYAARDSNVTGESRLQGTRVVGGVECLDVTSKVHADRATLGEVTDVKGAGTATLDSTISLVVPVDTKLPLAMEEATTQAKVQARIKDKQSTDTIKLTITRYRKANYTPMP
jgi:hypothetical protein